MVLPTDGYFPVRAFATSTLATMGVRVEFAPTAGPYPSFEGVRLLLLETPANPGLDVCDVAELADRAHAAGALVVVDNTTATPLGQRPLDLGADLVVASGTKALTGHSDLLLGYVATRSAGSLEPLRAWRRPPARYLVRSTPGWRTGRWPPSTCGWVGRAPTLRRWPWH